MFKEELGELDDYENWLLQYEPEYGARTSYLSGKEVIMDIPDYCESSKFVSQDEWKEDAIDPLTINEVKDIDSIMEAIKDKWIYVGNKSFGTSNNVESSDIVMDSSYVLDSINVQQSSRVYNSSMLWGGTKYLYGCVWAEKGEFSIRVFGGSEVRRSFESSFLTDCGDLYFCHNSISCSELLFSFNQRNKHHCIGNLQLSVSKYKDLKKKLMAEVIDELKKTKQFPSLFELVPNVDPTISKKLPIYKSKEVGNMAPIEKAFSNTTKFLFKKELTGLMDYENWLLRYVSTIEENVSPFGFSNFIPESKRVSKILSHLPKKRTVSYRGALELGSLKMKEEDLINLDRIKKNLADIGYFTLEMYSGRSMNAIKCPIMANVSNTYSIWDAKLVTSSAFSMTILSSKYIFGSNNSANSTFGIHCYNSINLNRCFEIDGCASCADSYFCHNSYALSDCMFCFNVENKKYAIGNAEIPRDKYLKIKDSILQQMFTELEKKKTLKWDIFNIGC